MLCPFSDSVAIDKIVIGIHSFHFIINTHGYNIIFLSTRLRERNIDNITTILIYQSKIINPRVTPVHIVASTGGRATVFEIQ